MGDVTLAEAQKKSNGRMGLEGNIAIHDLMTTDLEHIGEIVRQALGTGRGKRFVLSTGYAYMYWPEPSQRYIRNLLTFIKEGTKE